MTLLKLSVGDRFHPDMVNTDSQIGQYNALAEQT